VRIVRSDLDLKGARPRSEATPWHLEDRSTASIGPLEGHSLTVYPEPECERIG
jgi:hypothetical protein